MTMVLAKLMEMIVAHPDPVGLRVVQVLNLLGGIKLAHSERQGQSTRYSKFAEPGSLKGRTVPSKTGMAILYSPAAIFCSSFLLNKLFSPAPDHRLIIFVAALTVHFVKRLVEVFFVHKYSGSMELSVSFSIAIFYLMSSIQLVYAQHVATQLQPPSMDLMAWGLMLFVVGITGNFYHHCLLARLRTGKDEHGNKQYVTPQGGLFTWVVCPHYFFECIDFLGLALIGQTTTAFVNALATFLMLSARSQSTKQWYLKKIDNFPKDRKAFLPFIF